MLMYPCERCKVAEALPKQKYCNRCKKEVIAEMEHAGYLQPVPRRHAGTYRTTEMKELTRETKFGTSHG
jgi:hypothetical protein